MNATVAQSPWPLPASTEMGALRFGRAWTDAQSRVGLQWVLRRNCSITPKQLALSYAALCALLIVIAAGFAWVGAIAVLAFAGLELLFVGAALVVYARHARDGETLTLAGQSLAVEQAHGGRTRRTEFRAEWVSVEPAHGEGSLVELSGQGQRVCVARFLRPDLRGALARELRQALRTARQPAATQSDSSF